MESVNDGLNSSIIQPGGTKVPASQKQQYKAFFLFRTE